LITKPIINVIIIACNIGYTRGRKTQQNTAKHNTICVVHHYTQTNTNNVYKTMEVKKIFI